MNREPFLPFHYLQFAKRELGSARFPLGLSGVLDRTLADLREHGLREDAVIAGYAEAGQAYEGRLRGLAERYGVPQGHVAPALGTSGAIFMALAALSSLEDGPRRVVIETPAYGAFEAAARILGLEVQRFPRRREEGYGLDLAALDAAMAGPPAIACVTDLHNPSGAALTAGELDALHAVAQRHGGWVLLDEVYRDFLPGPVATGYRAGGRVVTCSSLTKCYGVSGARLGWILAPPRVVDRITALVEITQGAEPAPTVALLDAAVAIARPLLEEGRRIAARGRRVMDAWIEGEPRASWVPPAAGLTGLVHLEGLTDSMAFARDLRRELDVQVVPGAFFDAEGAVRVSFGLPPALLQQALDTFSLGLGALLR